MPGAQGSDMDIWDSFHAVKDEDLELSLTNDLTTVVSGLTMSSAIGSTHTPGKKAGGGELSPPGFNSGGKHRVASSSSSGDPQASNSFSNLAEMLGTGLAQSLDGTTDELNYQRQSRHAAYAKSDGVVVEPDSSSFPGFGPSDRNVCSLGASPNLGFPSSFSRQNSCQNQPPSSTGIYGTSNGATAAGIQGSSLQQAVAAGVTYDTTNFSSGLNLPPQKALSSNARAFQPNPIRRTHSNDSSASGRSKGQMSTTVAITSQQAEVDLQQYFLEPDSETPSRTIAVLHVAFLGMEAIQSACENYGEIESFRTDFSAQGIYFVSYHDIRNAQYAAVKLQPVLQRMSVMHRAGEDVVVQCCLDFNSNSQLDAGKLSLSDLPLDISEQELKSILSTYGPIRRIVTREPGSFQIEFQSIKDAAQAQEAVETTQPFGPDAFIETCIRDAALRKKGRDFLSMIKKWGESVVASSLASSQDARQPENPPNPWHSQGQASTSVASSLLSGTEVVGMGAAYGNTVGHSQRLQTQHQPRQETAQLVLGPDGRYTPVIVQSQMPYQQNFTPPAGATPIDPRHQQIYQGPDGQIYLAPVSAPSTSGHFYAQQHTSGFEQAPVQGLIPPNQDMRRQPRQAYYSNSDAGSVGGRSHHSHNSHHSHRSAFSNGTDSEKDTRHLVMDLDAVESGADMRTSLMVRNIPNKYTQHMLISEFAENGHGPGVIDFFYLPIDFKNRCNRGYAFINFVNFQDILPFHQRYYGKHWRTFNSDKICDITYARIQGKAAMLKRFENSALMEKDEEYKPLVFASDGPDKGARLPFPDVSRTASD